MSTDRVRSFLFIAALLLPGGDAPAAGREETQWTPEALIEQLSGDDAKAKRLAGIRLKNLDGTALESLERVFARQDLAPEARDAVKAALPPVRVRARRLRLTEDVRAYELKATLEAYERTGARDPRWDGLVRDAMSLFAAPLSQNVPPSKVAAAFREATDAGCTDPLVLFLSARSEWAAIPADRAAVLALHRKAALALPKTKHPTEFTWRSAVRYLEQLEAADEEVGEVALQALPKALAETGRPNRDVADFIDTMHNALTREGSEQQAFERIYPVYAKSRPANDPGPLVYKGRWYITWAWAARGSGFADTVTPEGWKLFAERLAVAREALEKAWAVDPQDERAAADMIRVCIGQGGDKGEMEMWFRRAMNVNPDDRTACSYKLRYLFPRWHGSPAQMLVFGRQCVATQNYWAGLPTILVDAHEDLSRSGGMERSDYFAQPEVWHDIESVYRPFIDAYPDSPRTPWYRNKLAKWACDCQQWDAAHAAFSEIGDVSDRSVFRSPAVYNYYRKKAQRLSNRAQQVYADPAAG